MDEPTTPDQTEAEPADLGLEDLPTPTQPIIDLDHADHPARPLLTMIEAALVGLCSLLVFLSMHPELIFRNTTPTGGDMGAHVWGPAFLRDHLLPDLRLSGWSDDWYAGFPAYTFYMVLPALLILAVSTGLPVLLAPIGVLLVVAGTVRLAMRTRGEARLWIIVAGVVLTVLCIPVPYNVAFKLIVVAGLVALPICAWAMGRLADAPYPVPPLLALGAMMFLYDAGKSTTISGGNVASTMAGEFSFALSLPVVLLFLGTFIRAIRTGRYYATAAVLYGIVLMLHVIPAIYGGVAAILVVLLEADVFVRRPRRLLALGIPIVGVLVAGFWMVPFYLNRTYLNDMGWEKATEYKAYLWPNTLVPRGGGAGVVEAVMLYRNEVFVLAALGAVLSIVLMLRLGWLLAGIVFVSAVGFVLMPQGRFWNIRILPAYRLGLYLLAAVAVGLMILVVGELWRSWRRKRVAPVWNTVFGVGVASLTVMFAILVPLHLAPFGQSVREVNAEGGSAVNKYTWLGREVTSTNNARSWAEWNFKGVEGAPGAKEFLGMIEAMREVGNDPEHGCGRAMWEYGGFLEQYGTPMAPMLLPYYTDGCIDSMEGLFFEASATTPFHFLNQSELSEKPSSAMRDIPYRGFDINAGIEHLRLFGVRYYMTYSDAATKAAESHGGLRKVTTSSKWTVWELENVALVEGLDREPAVWEDVPQGVHGWVLGDKEPDPNDPTGKRMKHKPGPAVEWYNDSSQWSVMRAADGPANWQRIRHDEQPEEREVRRAQVSNIRMGDERISFEVDEPGTPVVVRMSYFPNWEVEGAEGVYRVAPNLMVVVPTANRVTLNYARSGLDVIGMVVTVFGIAAAVGLSLLARRLERRATTAPDTPDSKHPESDDPEGQVPAGSDGPVPDGQDSPLVATATAGHDPLEAADDPPPPKGG